MLYTVFHTATGKILRSGACQEIDIELQAGDGQSVVERENPDHHDGNAYVLSGVVTARPAMGATLSGMTINNIPAGAVLTIENTDYIINDGSAVLSFSAAGTYEVKLSHWPHYDQTFEVVAT